MYLLLMQKTYALVVNGDVLSHVFVSDKSKFLKIGTQCRSVICTRVTPLQKAMVVRLVKDSIDCLTLAIGDGANDVSMIQEAHIGVGIMGKEGTQAVRAADYSMGEFKFLKRLLSVHGRWNLLRLTHLILYSFYKNFVFIMIQFLFGFTSAWTGQLVYEELFFTAFNVAFTSLPPLAYGIYETDLNDSQIDKNPELYQELKGGLFWSGPKIAFWLILSFTHAVMIFGTVYLTNFEGATDIEGRSTGYWVQAYLFSTPMLLTVLGKLAAMSKNYVWPIYVCLAVSLILNVAVMFALVVLDAFYYTDYATANIIHALPAYYLLCVLMPAACIVPDMVIS